MDLEYWGCFGGKHKTDLDMFRVILKDGNPVL